MNPYLLGVFIFSSSIIMFCVSFFAFLLIIFFYFEDNLFRIYENQRAADRIPSSESYKIPDLPPATLSFQTADKR